MTITFVKMLLNRFWTQSYKVFITLDVINKNVATLHNDLKKKDG